MTCAAVLWALVALAPGVAQASETASADTLKRYEAVISRAGELNLYGYDLKFVTLKLKKMTDSLLAGDEAEAVRVLDDIDRDLRRIETKGSEHFRRERERVWMEIYGDFIRQFSIFIVLSFLLLKPGFVRRNLASLRLPFKDGLNVGLIFGAAAAFAGTASFTRFEQSSWVFIDLELVFVTAAGLFGGPLSGLVAGCLNVLLRLAMVPEWIAPVLYLGAAGLAAGLFRRCVRSRPVSLRTAAAAGAAVSLVHGLLAYRPMWPYLPPESLGIAVFLLSATETAIFVLFFVFVHQILREQQAKETERELFSTQLAFLRAQINPHFLFNALNTIASVCGDENAERARNLIIQLSSLLRRLSRKQGDFVSLREELDYIDHYLEIEKARFGEKLTVAKEILLSEARMNMPIPILVLQPVVENAVKHGISKKAEGGVLTIRAREEAGRVVFEVADTGAGMAEERAAALFSEKSVGPSGDHAGIGLENIRLRLMKLYGPKTNLTVTSRPGAGTTVTITLPGER
ncbi:MAG: sensor histidine kinase [Candidatus Omnitrophota bacterium]